MTSHLKLISCGLGLAGLLSIALVTGPAAAQTGVTESVYFNIPDTDVNANQADLDYEIGQVVSETPAYTFINTATTFDYNYNNGYSVADFLGVDGAGVAAVADDLNPNGNVGLTAITATGTLSVSTPGLYTLTLPSADDAASVTLGGATIIEQNFNYPGSGPTPGFGLTYPSTATVDITGPESFSLFYYNLGGNADVDFTISGPGAVSYSTGSISAAPEPASWALMMLGLGAVGAALRSRRYRPSLSAAQPVGL